MNTEQVQFDTLRSVAEASITNAYTALGAPFSHPVRLFSVVNNTDGDMFFSTDGTNNHIFLPKNSYRIYDLGSNRYDTDKSFYLAPYTQIYIKYSSAPTTGSVYLECIYGSSTVGYTAPVAS